MTPFANPGSLARTLVVIGMTSWSVIALASSGARAEDECKVETSPGVFVSCRALLDQAQGGAPADTAPTETRRAAPPPPTPPATPSPNVAPKALPLSSKNPAFAKDLTASEASRLRDTKIDWDRGKASANERTGGLRTRGLGTLRDAQEDTSPLGQERLRVDHLKSKLYNLERSHRQWEKRTLVDLRLEVERALRAMADIERLALGRMQSCRYGKGLKTEIKTVKMTASGPVRLSNAEVQAQAAGVDDPVCARNTLVTQAQIDDVNEMHTLRNEIEDGKFGYWSRTKLRTAQDRVAFLKRKHFGYKRKKEDIRDVDRVPSFKKTDDTRRSVGSGENRAEPLNARDSKARR